MSARSTFYLAAGAILVAALALALALVATVRAGDDGDAATNENVHTMPNGQMMTGSTHETDGMGTMMRHTMHGGKTVTGPMHTMSGGKEMQGMTHTSP